MDNTRYPVAFAVLVLIMALITTIEQQSLSQEIKQGMWNGREIEYLDGQVRVKLLEGITEGEFSQLVSRLGGTIAESPDALRWALVRLPVDADVFSTVETLMVNPLIESCGPNMIGYVRSDPDDDFFSTKQWPLYNQGDWCDPDCCEPGEDINVRKAWGITFGSPTVLISVLDSGIPLDLEVDPPLVHPEFMDEDRIILGADHIFGEVSQQDEPESSVKDQSGHGTFVAGIIGAKTNNSEGIAGIAGDCKLRIEQVVAKTNSPTVNAFEEGVIAAIIAGARIINFSSSFLSGDQQLIDAIEAARDADTPILIVAAAGDIDQTHLDYPAAYALDYTNLISVSGITCTGVSGEGAAAGSELRIVAPFGGTDNYFIETAPLFSTWPEDVPGGDPSGYMEDPSTHKTSWSAAHVSGIAGLMLSVNSSLNPAQVRDILERTANDKGVEGLDVLYGWGSANAYQAVLLSLAYGAQSHSENATAGNGQRKLLRESDGTLHQAFESGGEIYFRNSTTGGTSWKEPIRISSGTEDNSSVCITERSGNVYAVWQKPTDTEENPPPWNVMYNYSTDGGVTWLDAPAILDDEVGSPSVGPQPVIMSTTPSASLGLMLVFNSGNGLYESHSTSGTPPWSTPAAISGTDADSKAPALAYRVSGSNPYKLVWDDVVSGSKRIYVSSWNGSSWGGLTQINSGSLTGEEKPTISVTASNAVDIAWQGMHSGHEAIIHNRNQAAVYTIFEHSVLGYSNPTITGHDNGNMTLVWEVSGGAIYKVKYNGTSWGSVSSIGSTSANPSTSILNPAGGDAKVFWTQETTSPVIFNIYMPSQTLNRTTADSSFEVHREIVLTDTLTNDYFSIQSAEVSMYAGDGSKQTVGYVPVYDSLVYTPGELVELMETEPFTVPSGIETISVTRSILGRTLGRFFTEASVRFEVENASTGEVVATFGTRQLDGQDTLNVRDSTTLSVRGLPRASLKIRTVIEGLDLMDPGVKVSLLNILRPKDVEQVLEKISSGQPTVYSLSQNYPNPFNPTTNIGFELPSDSYVSLKVFDVLGREVVTLVEGDRSAGSHRVTLNASQLSSGIYFYRLEAADFTETRRLVLLK